MIVYTMLKRNRTTKIKPGSKIDIVILRYSISLPSE